jgi:hypothetical protein
MWFRFPEGTTGVSVDLQEFDEEVKDAEGLGYFRAPDYLAAKILDLPGFIRINPPNGTTDLDDLPARNSPNDTAISDLVSQVQALTIGRDDANERCQIALRQVHDLSAEIKRLKVNIGELETKLAAKIK